MDWRHRLTLALFCLQLMLIHGTYRSTDFEVHRNWLAITHSLPISKWYYEATSEWTLDYPPLFAWFEWALAWPASLFDRKMLAVSNLEYDSDATVLFQRLSVCATSLVLVAAMLHATRHTQDNTRRLTTFGLVVANAGLIMVDNIHFQYNGMLLGLLVWSLLMLQQQRNVLGGALFALLLNLKHLFATLGPVYFVHLLRHYVLGPSSSGGSSTKASSSSRDWAGALLRLVLLGGSVLAICGASFGPFIAMGQLGQVLSRLFPFGRGLCHAYWAPNAWALYSFADKLAAAVAVRLGLRPASATANMAGGIVGVSSYLILPNIGAGTCALLVLAALGPCLAALWRARDRTTAAAMMPAAVAYASLCGFMFGYHVHEKAALTIEVPMALAAVASEGWGVQYVILSSAAHVGIFPLLFGVQEVPVRWLLALTYFLGCVWGLASIHGRPQQQQQQQQASGVAADAAAAAAAGGSESDDSPVAGRTRRQVAARRTPLKQQQEQGQQHGSGDGSSEPPAASEPPGGGCGGWMSLQQCCSWLPLPHRLYLSGLVLLELYCCLAHTALFGEALPFVPLMLTSVYCALAFSWAWAWMAAWFLAQCTRPAGGSTGKQPAVAAS